MILHKFIVFEGIDGAGTSTQIAELKKRPDAAQFFFTAEPTEGETGKFLRRMLRGDIPLENTTAAYLFAADRNEHIYGTPAADGQNLIHGIADACTNGRTVVSDRYLFSSLAYQGVGLGTGTDSLPWQLNGRFPLPRLLFYFDIDPSVSLRRITGRGIREIYEKEAFLRQAAQNYREVIARLSAGEPEMKVVILDATKGIEELSDTIWAEITGLKA